MESNDTFQIPPPLSLHRFIFQSTQDANDPLLNPSSLVNDVSDDVPNLALSLISMINGQLPLLPITHGENFPQIVVNLPLMSLTLVRIISNIPKLLLHVAQPAHLLDL
jgi:hypothetical protein